MFFINFIKKSSARIAITCSSLLAACSIAMAAPEIPDSSNLPRIEPLPSFPKANTPEIEHPEKPVYKPAAPKNKEITLEIEKFKFSGNQYVSNEQLSFLLEGFRNRSLNMQDLNEVTRTLTQYYRKQGFLLAQAYLPVQDIRDKILEVAILEGNLGELKLRSSDKLNEAFLKKMAGHEFKSGDPVKESNLVRNVTVLNSLPGLRTSAQLNPGQLVGTSDAEIEFKPLPRWSSYVAFNTYGNRFTGREVAIAGLYLNNLRGIGDQMNIAVRSSINEGQRSLQLGYITPVHESGSLLNLNYNYVDYELGGQFKALGATGRSQYFNASIDQPLFRNSHSGAIARVGAAYKNMNDEVAAFALNNRRNIAAIELGLFGDWRDGLGNASNQAGINIRSGNVKFKDSFAEILDASGANTEGQFIKYSLFANRVQRFNNGLNLSVRAEYQGADQNLDSSEKISIGGINRWRAFGELPTSADRGFLTGIELRKTMPYSGGMAGFLLEGLSPYGFVDYGTGSINQNALSANNHVESLHYGLGLDTYLRNKWLLGLAVSHQKRELDGLSPQSETRAWGQLQAEF